MNDKFMSQRIPGYVTRSKILVSAISYKWDSEIATNLMDRENKKIESAVDKLTFKAGFATGVAITEWIVWRFEGHTELADAHKRTEAAWAAVIDVAYVRSLEKQLSDDEDFDDKQPIKGPLEAALDNLGEMFNDYAAQNGLAGERVATQALLARHLITSKPIFEQWLSAVLRRAVETFPVDLSHYNSATEEYDASYEKPVPQEFFDEDFPRSEAASKKALNQFLKTLDPKSNPYLRPAAEMKAHGFKGTPYAL